MSWRRRAAEAVVDALAAPTGAVPNGRLPRAARRPPLPGRSGFSEVVVKQPAAGGWGCDGCTKRGFGGVALLEHAAATDHLSYTAERHQEPA